MAENYDAGGGSASGVEKPRATACRARHTVIEELIVRMSVVAS